MIRFLTILSLCDLTALPPAPTVRISNPSDVAPVQSRRGWFEDHSIPLQMALEIRFQGGTST